MIRLDLEHRAMFESWTVRSIIRHSLFLVFLKKAHTFCTAMNRYIAPVDHWMGSTWNLDENCMVVKGAINFSWRNGLHCY